MNAPLPTAHCSLLTDLSSIYLSTPADRMFLLHEPTHILSEILLNAGSGGSHILRIKSGTPVPDDVFAAFAAYLQHAHPFAAENLAVISREDLTQELPEHLVMVNALTPAVLIHYPAMGFTAGIHEDGTKTPPHWQNPAILTPPQRSHFLAQAAETLIQAIAKPASPGQAT